MSGFVGDGMLDCSVVGDVFAAPGAQRLFQALQLMKREAGILLVVLNHSGDVMSANMACQLAERVGIKVKQLRLTMISVPVSVLRQTIVAVWLVAYLCIRFWGCCRRRQIIGRTDRDRRTLQQKSSYSWLLLCVLVLIRKNNATITDLPAGIMEIGMGQHGEGGGGQKPLVLPMLLQPKW